MAKRVGTAEFEAEVLKEKLPVIVEFYSDSGKYQVMASPTILFFKDGKEVDRIRGLVKRPELEDKVKTILE